MQQTLIDFSDFLASLSSICLHQAKLHYNAHSFFAKMSDCLSDESSDIIDQNVDAMTSILKKQKNLCNNQSFFACQCAFHSTRLLLPCDLIGTVKDMALPLFDYRTRAAFTVLSDASIEWLSVSLAHGNSLEHDLMVALRPNNTIVSCKGACLAINYGLFVTITLLRGTLRQQDVSFAVITKPVQLAK